MSVNILTNGILEGTMIESTEKVNIYGNDIAVGANLLKNSDKNTSANPFLMSSASTDGISCPGFYYNNFDLNKTYTLSVECDGTLNSGHGTLKTPADRYWTIWIYYHDTAFTDTDYNRYQNPICYNSSTAGYKKDGTFRYTWTFKPSKKNGSIRLNTYSDGSQIINVKFWNIKIEEGTKATPWIPNSEDNTYSSFMNNMTLTNPIEANEFYEV